MALLAQRQAAFFGVARAPRVQVAAAVSSRPSVSRSKAVTAQALFGFGSKSSDTASAAAQQYYICIDCGYIYDQGDFKKAPGSFRCPVCNSPKGRFKVYKGAVKGKPNNTGSAMKQRFSAKQW